MTLSKRANELRDELDTLKAQRAATLRQLRTGQLVRRAAVTTELASVRMCHFVAHLKQLPGRLAPLIAEVNSSRLLGDARAAAIAALLDREAAQRHALLTAPFSWEEH